ncbi:GIY-YIG nuclease family protein [Vibrio algarum]|uniref:GIY-YIG nuclease family protein n=1 Tax=Vibrio algarum TaxID=3020714 RepID=A0ABT4YXI4_9VIBR|nr:GIY-YIG nuclease family protein [Vibrio sp. KJ40-1]MDB1126175.1 GIY-YIG nuclease family protein [Vibrio sp. KJ40-1]
MSDKDDKPKNTSWWVYLIRNNNNALYCGVTNNLERRFKMHQTGKGAKALRGKGPLVLEWSQELNNKIEAMQIEYKIKRLKKADKEALIVDTRLFVPK